MIHTAGSIVFVNAVLKKLRALFKMMSASTLPIHCEILQMTDRMAFFRRR